VGEFRRNLTLAERAFIDIVLSSIEIYKKECFGILLGEKHKKHYMVYDVINFLSAKRSYEFVNVPTVRVNRVNYTLSRLTNLRVIGDFHSHPDGPDKLSGLDKKDVKNSGLTLTLLVVVEKMRGKGNRWRIMDKNLIGDIGNKYHVKIMAFEYDKRKDNVYQIKIVCPFLRKINKLKQLTKKI